MRILMIALLLLGPLLTSCQILSQPDTKLTGKGTYTGTVTMLRVDDGWYPDPARRGVYRVGAGYDDERERRFVPLRHKGDVRGLDTPDHIATSEDLVTVTLKSAFVKFFRELGGKRRKGEIAVVLSFDAGSSARDSFLIYSSQGQTLGSFLNLDDWPVIGPISIDADSLRIRVVMIELDQAENEQARQIVRQLADLAASSSPQGALAAPIAGAVAEAVIALNQDDVILDQRFALQRVEPGMSLERNPLLYGTYVLVLQEDRLQGSGAESVATKALEPPALSRMRFDLASQRVYRTYSHLPWLPAAATPAPSTQAGTGAAPPAVSAPSRAPCPSPDGSLPHIRAVWFPGDGHRDLEAWWAAKLDEGARKRILEASYRSCLLEQWVNAPEAIRIREEALGFESGRLADLDVYNSFSEATQHIWVEALRGEKLTRGENTAGSEELAEFERRIEENRQYVFEYPVTFYPEAFTVLAQYPLHTYIVLSIGRSIGGTGEPVDRRFEAYVDFLERERQGARSNSVARRLGETVGSVLETRKRRSALFQRVTGMEDAESAKKVCLLNRELPGDTTAAGEAPPLVSDAAVYNEIFHVTGDAWTSKTEVETYLREKKCNLTTCDLCARDEAAEAGDDV